MRMKPIGWNLQLQEPEYKQQRNVIKDSRSKKRKFKESLSQASWRANRSRWINVGHWLLQVSDKEVYPGDHISMSIMP